MVPVFDQLFVVMLSVSPLETLMAPWLVKLPLPKMLKVQPLKPALMVPALMRTLVVLPFSEVSNWASAPT